MNLSEDLAELKVVFIDTAPIIYFIEAHPVFGPLAREIVILFQTEKLIAFSSVITLVEVLPKPVEAGNSELTKEFSGFLKHGRNIKLLDISSDIAEAAGYLRGTYRFLKSMDAVQIAAAINVGADAFITNDLKLKQVNELRVIALQDYLK